MSFSRPPTNQPIASTRGDSLWVSADWLRWFNPLYVIAYIVQNYAVSQLEVPVDGATVQISDAVEYLLLDPAAALATLTVVLPAKPLDRAVVRVSSTDAVAAVTVTSTSATVKNPLVAIAAGGSFGYYWRQANSTWYRIQ